MKTLTLKKKKDRFKKPLQIKKFLEKHTDVNWSALAIAHDMNRSAINSYFRGERCYQGDRLRAKTLILRNYRKIKKELAKQNNKSRVV